MVFQYRVEEVGFLKDMGGLFYFSILRSWSERVLLASAEMSRFGFEGFVFEFDRIPYMFVFLW